MKKNHATPLILGVVVSCFYLFQDIEVKKRYLEIEYKTKSMGSLFIYADFDEQHGDSNVQQMSINSSGKVTKIRIPILFSHLDSLRIDSKSSSGELEFSQFLVRLLDGSGDEIETLWEFSDGKQISREHRSVFVELKHEQLLTYRDDLRKGDIFIGRIGLITKSFFLCYLFYFFIRVWSVPVLVAFLTWKVYFPGIFTPDSINVYNQAVTDVYFNWHPPVMAITLRELFDIGVSVQSIILGQLLMGFVGVFSLMRNLWFLIVSPDSRLAANRVAIGFIVLCVLPITPFTPFFATLWKDVWFSIDLIWIVSIGVRFILIKNNDNKSIEILFLACLFIFFSIHSIVIRHNAILLLPVYLVVFYSAQTYQSRLLRIVGIIFIMLASLSFPSLLKRIYDVKNLAPEQSVMGLELVGLIVAFPELLDEFPYTKSQIRRGGLERFQWAGYRYMKWGTHPYMKSHFVKFGENPPLRKEYQYAVKTHLLKLSYVKLCNFVQILDPRKTTEWFAYGIEKNIHQLEPNCEFQQLRLIYYKLLMKTSQNPVLKVLFSVHLTWLILSCLLLLKLLLFMKSKWTGDWFVHISLSMIPLIYTTSYLLACPWKAYRYLYPVTLLVQCFVWVIIASFFYQLLWQKRNLKVDDIHR